MTITIDFETRSFADLKKVGAWAYSEHASTDLICVCWGVDNEPIQEWWPGQTEINRIPFRLLHALKWHHEVEAHNVAFEKSIWHNVLHKRYGWPLPDPDSWRDTMAVACYYSLPAALDRLANVLGFEGKDPEGKRLITKYSCLYLKTSKLIIPPEDHRKFVDYCRKDVQIEQSISDYLGDLPARELPEFLLDEKINMRGIYLDIEGIEAAAEIVDKRSEELNAEFVKLTGYNPGQNAKVLLWFAEHGLRLDNLQADTLETILDDGLPQGICRRAIELRLQGAKASTKKLDAMSRQRGSDGRARFQSRYHGANTGRNTGTGIQVLNLNKGFPDVDPEQLVRDISYRDPRYLDVLYGDSMDAVSKASRHWIQAQPGNKIIAGDFVSVEAVILACGAGEEWKIQAFRDKVKIYCLMADTIYGYPSGTVTKTTHPQEYGDGKIGELAFGYQGALNAWLKFDPSGRHTDERIIEICKAWRAKHTATVAYWRGLEQASIEAVSKRVETNYTDCGFEIVDEWLTMILPDGKRLWYFKPELRMGMPQWHKPLENEECRAGTCRCRPVPKLTYLSQKTGQWKRVYTYGGKLTENWTQATSRQRLRYSMKLAERAGYTLVFTVYDELVAEVPKGFGSAAELKQIMLEAPNWAKDWPIGVEVWEGDRYKK